METWDRVGPVVVSVGGKSGSNTAVDWAADLAATTHRALVVAHVVVPPIVRLRASDLLEEEQRVAETGRTRVAEATARALERHPGLEVTSSITVGDALPLLLEQAQGAAVLVSGSRRGGERRSSGGSVSLALTRHAPCPVVVARAQADHGPLAQRVVLGVDGTAASRSAAAFAFGYAAMHGLHVVALHGSWERLARGSSVLSLLSASDEHGPTAEEELTISETVAGLPERYPDVEFRDDHRSTDPAEALVEASQTAQLVVVGSRGLGAVASFLLRSVSTSVVEHAHCPVAVVRASGS